MKSKFLTLNLNDAVKGLIVLVITSLLTGLVELLKGGAALNWVTIKPIIVTAVISAAGYIIKNWLTNSQGQFLTSEKLVAKPQANNGSGGTSKLRILIFMIMLSGFGIVASAQGLLYKPSPKDFTVKVKSYGINKLAINQDSVITSLSKWDLATGVNAMSLNLKTGAFGGFNSGGIGIVRAWYKETSDKLSVYKTFSAGGIILFGDTNQTSLFNLNTSTGKTDVGIMGVVGIGPISIGPTYFVISNTFLLNLQATFTIF
jgi:hypothetical protein